MQYSKLFTQLCEEFSIYFGHDCETESFSCGFSYDTGNNNCVDVLPRLLLLMEAISKGEIPLLFSLNTVWHT